MKKTIILVEDDADLRFILTKLLMGEGYEVVGLSDGTSIIEGHTSWPDLFILDNEMEYITGEAITKYLRLHAVARHIPVLMVSGQASRKSAAAAGVDFFIQKPFDFNEFKEVIQMLLNLTSPAASVSEGHF